MKSLIVFIILIISIQNSYAFLFGLFGSDESEKKGKTDIKSKYQKVLDKQKSNRLYIGAPPRIPHRLEKAFQDDNSCLNCHSAGGLGAPIVLHKNQKNCMQCHVLIKTNKLFKENNFKGEFISEIDHNKFISIPPYIPHRMQDRKDCKICHIDAGAKPELVPRHGNRLNCVQCHIKRQKSSAEFSR